MCLSVQAHIADPGHVNIYTSQVGFEATLAVIALTLAPITIEARKSVADSNENSEDFKPIPW